MLEEAVELQPPTATNWMVTDRQGRVLCDCRGYSILGSGLPQGIALAAAVRPGKNFLVTLDDETYEAVRHLQGAPWMAGLVSPEEWAAFSGERSVQ
jgi:hypothetical protein